MTQRLRYGVIGLPIEHSLSPQIHTQFAHQFDLQIDYQKYPVDSSKLATFVKEFFANGGCGLNVTLPHKQALLGLVDQVSERSQQARSVNTLSINKRGQLCGDSTDGVGLLHDLNRQGFTIKGQVILLVGAGGAAQPAISALLEAGAKVRLYNRTATKVIELVKHFQQYGEVQGWQSNEAINGLITSVSQFDESFFEPLKSSLQTETFCYDMNYGNRAANFLRFAEEAGCSRRSDGFGMLLAQAAESFQIWTGFSPDIEKVKLTSKR